MDRIQTKHNAIGSDCLCRSSCFIPSTAIKLEFCFEQQGVLEERATSAELNVYAVECPLGGTVVPKTLTTVRYPPCAEMLTFSCC